MSVQTGFQIERIVQTPRDLIWLGFTKSSFFNSWFGANGMSVSRSTIDPIPGGVIEYRLRLFDGSEIGYSGRFEEVLEGRLISYSGFTVDEHNDYLPNPNVPDWPPQTRVTVKLASVDEKCKVSLFEIPMNPSEAEVLAFHNNLDMLHRFWDESLKKLNDYSVDFWK